LFDPVQRMIRSQNIGRLNQRTTDNARHVADLGIMCRLRSKAQT
jgi:hypothetical protein